ncbi:MAG TPA: phosphoribosyltransferase family protein [Candidatus Dormibacteraeota bacterium]|nr:phosphoribosyltransferase family protein [Candidatus Dormibacteraeota bacterium]
MASSQEPGTVVLSAGAIASAVDELAARIAAAGPAPGVEGRLVLLCVLKGSLLLTADLARALHRRGVAVEIDVVAVRSYAGDASRGTVELVAEGLTALEGRDVLIVEDVVDTGLTTAFLLERIRGMGPGRLRVLALLDKPARRRHEVRIDFCGAVVGDHFLVGYGLDLDERHRELPDVRALPGTGAGG